MSGEAQRIAQIIVDAPDEWSPEFTRSELLPLARALLERQALREQVEAAEKARHLEQRDRNWWAANASRERARLEARAVRAEEALRGLLAEVRDFYVVGKAEITRPGTYQFGFHIVVESGRVVPTDGNEPIQLDDIAVDARDWFGPEDVEPPPKGGLTDERS